MKPVFTLFLIISLLSGTTEINAQGIFQLWGMTKDGGDDDAGSMFSTTYSGNNFQERHQFNIANPGAYPQLTNLVEYNGKFYGMTQQGGISNSGLIFEWDPATNIYTKKYAFNGYDGSGPLGSLSLYNGKFYGMTEFGGDQSQGVIFEWDPATNIYTKKIDFIDNFFDGYNGYRPAGNLTISNGKFYGMTSYGGNDDKGVIFEWDPATNGYTKKFDFNGTNGSTPYGDLVLSGGKFYGMTTMGGNNGKGVIFQWDPSSNTYTKKKEFNGTNGSNPYSSLTIKGTGFIGVAQHGGINDDGVIFEWNPVSNAYSKKYDFNNSDGYWPSGVLALKDGKYYSTAFGGGMNDMGVIFEWDPAAVSYTKKVDLNATDGKSPQSSLALHDGTFYGMTVLGGNFGKGVIFKWDPSANIYTKKLDLGDIGKGISPAGSLEHTGGKLYGMTNAGGSNNDGVIFEWDPSENTYTKKFDFDAANGGGPTGSLALGGHKLYGMTKSGGSDGAGVIFEWDPSCNAYAKKVDLTFDNGGAPQGSLVFSSGKFYGMTSTGGDNGAGVIFEWDTTTDIYTKKISLATATGGRPYGDLAAYNGKFYGMTNKGGINNSGVIFEWDPSTNIYTKKIDFNNTDGKTPYGSLTLFQEKFYGMTAFGGANDKGVIFEWNPATNVYTKKIEFSNTDTYNPLGNLTVSGSKLYGMTREGGNNDGGVVFEWDPISNDYTKKSDLAHSSGGQLPGIITDMSLAPAPVAKGVPNTCTSFAAVTIDDSNNNIWVPIIDENGDAVAEIKANGHNLGVVNTSMYINTGTVREDGSKRLYLDRNLTITPEFPLSSGSVNIRLYIKNSEYLQLKNSSNSAGQPSGIGSINDIGIFKNTDGCGSAIAMIANPVATTAENWQKDYVLSASINSFSSFYFANKAEGGPLPITRLELNGRIEKEDAAISWKTTDEFNTQSFDLERSVDGISFKTITNVSAVNQTGVHQYYYTDKRIASLGSPVIYYRVKQNDRDGKFTYSGIVPLNVKNNNTVMLYPNPVIDKTNLTIGISKAGRVQGRIIDNAGRVVMNLQWDLPVGTTSLPIDASMLSRGVYYLDLKGEAINEQKQFIKQ